MPEPAIYHFKQAGILWNSHMVIGFYKKIHRPIVLERTWAEEIFKNLMETEYLGSREKMVPALHIVERS